MVGGEVSWPANVFLLHVFKWISAPLDIDGDGKMTVIDSYKYAGVLSNSGNKNVKIGNLHISFELHQKWANANAQMQANPNPATDLIRQAIEKQYLSALQICYVHQECWILNAIPAQSIEF